MLDYHWERNETVTAALSEIEVLRKVYAAMPVLPHIEERLLRHSLLKSAVFSARIEGIPSTVHVPKVEAQNLLSVYQRIFSGKESGEFSVDLLKKLHASVMRHLSATGGQLRSEPWAVYNQAGMAIHIAPPHFKLPEMLSEYADYINGLYDHPVEVAAVAQFVFEKIHPFADGNGRTGRLVSAYLLEKGGYGFKGLLMLEEYIEQHREEYYSVLEPSSDATGFVEFFCKAVVVQAKKGLELYSQQSEEPGPSMLPRREEILAVIRDHPRCSFDFLTRRFSTVNTKTLHYDMQWLITHKMVRKLGVTRGAVYEAV